MKWIIPFILATPLFAQTDSTLIRADSTVAPRSFASTPLVPSRTDSVSGYHPTKSPGLALLFSALVPGAGQFYNESYWKVPVVIGFGVYFGSQWLHNNSVFRDYRDQYLASITVENPGGNVTLQRLRDFYRDQRDTFSWYLFIWYLVNVADAYVDASLYDFNVGDDLSIKLTPEAGTRLTLRVSF